MKGGRKEGRQAGRKRGGLLHAAYMSARTTAFHGKKRVGTTFSFVI